MLKNLHVIISNKEKEQFNFWEQEIYSDIEFAEAYLDVQLLLKEEVCNNIERDEEKNEQE